MKAILYSTSIGSQGCMLRQMVEAPGAIAADTPLILLIEDLQWSDHATLNLLAYFARRTEPAWRM